MNTFKVAKKSMNVILKVVHITSEAILSFYLMFFVTLGLILFYGKENLLLHNDSLHGLYNIAYGYLELILPLCLMILALCEMLGNQKKMLIRVVQCFISFFYLLITKKFFLGILNIEIMIVCLVLVFLASKLILDLKRKDMEYE